MPTYVLDTNVFIEAQRSAEWAASLALFLMRATPSIYMSAVVVSELRRGVRTNEVSTLDRELIGPFERRSRIVTPSYVVWAQAGRVIADLARKEGATVRDLSRALQNDVLIALSSKDAGASVVTTNARDFERISRVVRFSWLQAWDDVQFPSSPNA